MALEVHAPLQRTHAIVAELRCGYDPVWGSVDLTVCPARRGGRIVWRERRGDDLDTERCELEE